MVRLKVRVDGRIKDIWSEGLEGNDRLRVEPDGRAAELAFQVQRIKTYVAKVGLEEPAAVPLRVPDVDEIGLVLDPPDSRVRIDILSPEEGGAPVTLRVGHRLATSGTSLRANDPVAEIGTVPTEETAGTRPEIWVYRFPSRNVLNKQVPKDVQERLRALGYVQ
jgi:hypothetical protein